MDTADQSTAQMSQNALHRATIESHRKLENGQSLALLCAQLELQDGGHVETEAEVVNRFQKWNIILENMVQRVYSKWNFDMHIII